MATKVRVGDEACISAAADSLLTQGITRLVSDLRSLPECPAVEGGDRRHVPYTGIGEKRGRGRSHGAAWFKGRAYRSPRELALWGMPYGQLAVSSKANAYDIFENPTYPKATDAEWKESKGIGVPHPDLLGKPYPEVYQVSGGGGGEGWNEGRGAGKRGTIGDPFRVEKGIPNPLWEGEKPRTGHFVTITDVKTLGLPTGKKSGKKAIRIEE